MTYKFRFSFLALPLALVALVCLSIGCNKKTTDDQLATNVQNHITADTALASQQISVTAKDGTVTLTGSVSDPTARLLASKDASAVEGVRTVVNNLTTTEAAEAAAPSANEQPAKQPTQSAAAPPARPARAAVPSRREQARSELARRAAARSSAISQPAADAAAPVQNQSIVIPAGTRIQVQLAQTLSSKSSHTGDQFSGTVATPVQVSGQTVIPSGARASGTVTESKAKGRFKGEATLGIQLDSVNINGRAYEVRTSHIERVEAGKGKRSAVITGGGAGLGALIGGLAGGGKGALIGGLLGAGGGAAGSAMTGNQDLVLPAETVVTFVLQNSVTVQP